MFAIIIALACSGEVVVVSTVAKRTVPAEVVKVETPAEVKPAPKPLDFKPVTVKVVPKPLPAQGHWETRYQSNGRTEKVWVTTAPLPYQASGGCSDGSCSPRRGLFGGRFR